MPTIKKRIYVGNTLTVRFVCQEPNDDGISRDDLYPQSGYAELWDVQNQAFVPLGEDEAQQVAITPQGNVLSYTLPAAHTSAAGDYKLFVTAVIEDGRTVTEVRDFKILEKQ